MTLHTQWDTTMIADVATGVEDFYFQEQIQTIIKPRFCPWLCQFVMKMIPVTNWMCACVKTSVEDDNFLTEGWGSVNLMIFIWDFFNVLVWHRESIIPGNFGFAISVCKLRERVCMCVCVSWLRIIEIIMFFVVRSDDSFNFPLDE